MSATESLVDKKTGKVMGVQVWRILCLARLSWLLAVLGKRVRSRSLSHRLTES